MGPMANESSLPSSVVDIAQGVAQGTVTAERVVDAALQRAEQTQSLNAFLCVNEQAARRRAQEIDERVRRGAQVGKLAGVPIGLKDTLCTQDAPTTAASRILTRDGKTHASGWVPAYDATVVERLRAADAVLIGKTNMDEFAMGSSNENSAFGPAKNPWDERRTPGGSSGGSAACVAAGSAAAALGSDTGGSIRQPAGFCGVVGIKPSYGRVSRYGLIAFASSLDQVGPMTLDVRSAARVLEVIAGPDGRDSTCSRAPVGAYEAACERDVRGLRIGVPEEYFAEGLDDEVREAVTRVIEALRAEGAEIQRVHLPHTRYGLSSYYIVATAETSSNLSRFDGVRFGLRVEEQKDLETMYARTRDVGFGAEVKRRIMLGTYALSSGYYDAYYKKAQQVRTLIRRDFDQVFQQVDALIAPSSPGPAFELGTNVNDPVRMYLADVYTLPASLAGICGITVPAALSHQGLPIGVQMLAPAFEEERLFRLAAGWERCSPVAGRRPAAVSASGG